MSRPQPQQQQPEQQPAPQQTRPKVQPWRNPPAAVLLPADEGGQAAPQQMRRAGRPRQYALASGWIAPNNVFHPLAEGELHGDFAARHLGVPDRSKAFDQLHRTGWVRVAAPGHFGQSIYKITTHNLRSSGPRDRIADFLYGLPANQEVQVGDSQWQNHRGLAHEVVGKLFGSGERMSRPGPPRRMAVQQPAAPAQPAHWRAPAGGMVVRGNYYQGGKLVPGEAQGQPVKPKKRKMTGLLRELKNALVVKYAEENEHEAFSQAIRENPSDHGPRLVYADYLQDHGFPAVAEAIQRGLGHIKDARDVPSISRHGNLAMARGFASAHIGSGQGYDQPLVHISGLMHNPDSEGHRTVYAVTVHGASRGGLLGRPLVSHLETRDHELVNRLLSELGNRDRGGHYNAERYNLDQLVSEGMRRQSQEKSGPTS